LLQKFTRQRVKREVCKTKTTTAFEQATEHALKGHIDFCYETNFDIYPTHWATKFREEGFKINLIFFCIENQEIARHRIEVRIEVRTEFNGHFVDNQTIDLKWKAGYKNLNEFYQFFDNILIVDNSKHNEVYTNILEIKNGILTIMTEPLPDYFERRLPNIYTLVKNSK
jgi:predicted ABC-type ATPase